MVQTHHTQLLLYVGFEETRPSQVWHLPPTPNNWISPLACILEPVVVVTHNSVNIINKIDGTLQLRVHDLALGS